MFPGGPALEYYSRETDEKLSTLGKLEVFARGAHEWQAVSGC